jgi:hypothetical protein
VADFLTTHATAYNIENIILNSKSKLVLVSPYLQVSKTFIERLTDADERGVEMLVIYGKDKLAPEERDQLNRLKNLSLMFCENLHAKCYFNEDEMVITSMNMYEFSEKNNREMGVLIKRVVDAQAYNDAVLEIQSIVRASVKTERNSSKQNSLTTTNKDNTTNTLNTNVLRQDIGKILGGMFNKIFTADGKDAYCIRCGNRLEFDTLHPMCEKCYGEWAKYKKDDYKERFCHKCGNQAKTTKVRPLCPLCFRSTGR